MGDRSWMAQELLEHTKKLDALESRMKGLELIHEAELDAVEDGQEEITLCVFKGSGWVCRLSEESRVRNCGVMCRGSEAINRKDPSIAQGDDDEG